MDEIKRRLVADPRSVPVLLVEAGTPEIARMCAQQLRATDARRYSSLGRYYFDGLLSELDVSASLVHI